MKKLIISVLLIQLQVYLLASPAYCWKNGSNDGTYSCAGPAYGTHDWISDHALSLLPDKERKWLTPYISFFFIGTEAPDNKIPPECRVPDNGIADTRDGHSIQWSKDFTRMEIYQPAKRAKEEYSNALMAYRSGNLKAAAYYLGAMTHYIGDVSSYPHSTGTDKHHGTYEGWVERRTESFRESVFKKYIQPDRLEARAPDDAARRISCVVAYGGNKGALPCAKPSERFSNIGAILSANEMDDIYQQKDKYSDEFEASVGQSLSLAVNEIADVLHGFYLEGVKK